MEEKLCTKFQNSIKGDHRVCINCGETWADHGNRNSSQSSKSEGWEKKSERKKTVSVMQTTKSPDGAIGNNEKNENTTEEAGVKPTENTFGIDELHHHTRSKSVKVLTEIFERKISSNKAASSPQKLQKKKSVEYKTMAERIKSIIGENVTELDIQMFDKLPVKLQRFNEGHYENLEDSGKESFDNVKRMLDLKDRKVKAVKFFEIEKNSDKVDVLISLLTEIDLFQTLKKNRVDHLFPKLHGGYYDLDENGELKHLILISEAGSVNLDDLINCRMKEHEVPYSTAEALQFLREIIPSFCALQKLRIYHSDIKTSNIVYSNERKTYMLIDFGVASMIPPSKDNSDFVDINEFGNQGTEYFSSPEKNKLWKGSNVNEGEKQFFNPFACDMYSLGVVIEQMIKGTEFSKEHDILCSLLKEIKNEDWKSRFTANQVLEYLQKNANDTNMKIDESLYLELLNHKRKEECDGAKKGDSEKKDNSTEEAGVKPIENTFDLGEGHHQRTKSVKEIKEIFEMRSSTHSTVSSPYKLKKKKSVEYTAMKERIESLIGKDVTEFSIQIFDKLPVKLRRFNEGQYKSLEKLGKGFYGSVKRMFDQNDRTVKAVKFFDIKVDDKLDVLISLMTEIEMFQTLKKSHVDHMFPKLYGGYYDFDKNGQLKHLILISEAGDFNLNELINCRMKNLKVPYSKVEALQFLREIIPSFCALQKLRIYHSDIKTSNIVYSNERKTYMLIDFGVASIIPPSTDNDDLVDINEFGNQGTEYFFSPEKNRHWTGLNVQEGEKYLFNPFACDMYSLGVVIDLMIKGTELSKEPDILSSLLKEIKNEDWKARFTANQVSEYLEKIAFDAKMEIDESAYLELLNRQRMQEYGFTKIYEAYNSASLFSLQLKVAQDEYILIKEKEPVDQSKLAGVLERLGKAHLNMKEFDKGLNFLKERNQILKGLKKKDEPMSVSTRTSRKTVGHTGSSEEKNYRANLSKSLPPQNLIQMNKSLEFPDHLPNESITFDNIENEKGISSQNSFGTFNVAKSYEFIENMERYSEKKICEVMENYGESKENNQYELFNADRIKNIANMAGEFPADPTMKSSPIKHTNESFDTKLEISPQKGIYRAISALDCTSYENIEDPERYSEKKNCEAPENYGESKENTGNQYDQFIRENIANPPGEFLGLDPTENCPSKKQIRVHFDSKAEITDAVISSQNSHFKAFNTSESLSHENIEDPDRDFDKKICEALENSGKSKGYNPDDLINREKNDYEMKNIANFYGEFPELDAYEKSSSRKQSRVCFDNITDADSNPYDLINREKNDYEMKNIANLYGEFPELDAYEKSSSRKQSRVCFDTKTNITDAVRHCTELDISICEQLGLRPFDKKVFKNLEKIGENDSPFSLYKGLEKATCAYKTIKYLKSENLSKSGSVDRLVSFFTEKEILEKQANCENFPKLFGSFYDLDREGKISYLILVTEGEFFSLEQLIKCRRNEFNKFPPYSPEEAFAFLEAIIPKFCDLEEKRIYHSKINPKTIVFSEQRKSFMLFDFGLAVEIPKSKHNEDVFDLDNYGKHYSYDYSSPEKKFFNNSPEDQRENHFFNPFACDIYSLGHIIEEMIGGIENSKPNEMLYTVLKQIKNEDWKNRWTAQKVWEYISQNAGGKQPTPKSALLESMYLEKLEQQMPNMRGAGRFLFNKTHSGSCLFNLQLKAAQDEFRIVNEKFCVVGSEMAAALEKLGDAHFNLKQYHEGIKCFNEQKNILANLSKFGEDAELFFIERKIEECYRNLAKVDENLAEFKNFLESQQKSVQFEESLERAHIISQIASHNLIIGKHNESLDYFERAMDLKKRLIKNENHLDIADIHCKIGWNLNELGKHKEALDHFKQAFEIKRCVFDTGTENMEQSYTKRCIAFQLYQLGSNSEVVEIYQQILEMYKNIQLPEEHAEILMTVSEYALVLEKIGNHKEALEQRKRILDIYKNTNQSVDDPRIINCLQQIWEQLKKSFGTNEDTKDQYQQILESYIDLNYKPY